MCNADADLDGLMPYNQVSTITPDDVQTDCNKCGQKGALYKLHFREAECRDCFLFYVRHKFRAAIGTLKILSSNAKILIAFDGSAEAIVLTDMVHYAMSQNEFKRLRVNNCCILYIDKLFLQRHYPSKDDRKHLEDVKKFLSRYEKFETFIINIADGQKVYNFNNIDDYMDRNKTLENVLKEKTNNIFSHTSWQDYVKYIYNKAINEAGLQLKRNFIFEPDICSSIASKLLSSVVLGRATSTALDVGIVDDRFKGNIKRLRPIKNLKDAEVRLYLCAQELPNDFNSDVDDHAGIKNSLQNLTEKFISDLQLNYPATVSTIFRTSDKIVKKNSSNELICDFCNAPLDRNDSPTLLAMTFSRIASGIGDTLSNSLRSESCAFSKLLESYSYDNNLCHACCNIKNDTKNKKTLK